ncbi:DMT family transporter [Sphaerochaeta pleomorpha]|nr:DMT family transporter [Sphaerochaeta pleomorpha]
MNKSILYAVGAASLYALHAPFSKYLLNTVPPTMLAALLYLGAGMGVGLLILYQLAGNIKTKAKDFEKRDVPYVVLMVLLDIAAPICLMAGLSRSLPSTVSLLNNFEIIATVLIASLAFKEVISPRLWVSILLICIASILLSVEDFSSIHLTRGSLFVIAACTFWGLENNCTRQLSAKNPLQLVFIKGICSGLGTFVIARSIGQALPPLPFLLASLTLGFITFGLSISLYILAQRNLGAAKTSAFYALAPFIGATLSLLFYWEKPTPSFLLAFALMGAGTIFSMLDQKEQTIKG